MLSPTLTGWLIAHAGGSDLFQNFLPEMILNELSQFFFFNLREIFAMNSLSTNAYLKIFIFSGFFFSKKLISIRCVTIIVVKINRAQWRKIFSRFSRKFLTESVLRSVVTETTPNMRVKLKIIFSFFLVNLDNVGQPLVMRPVLLEELETSWIFMAFQNPGNLSCSGRVRKILRFQISI